MKRIPRMLLAPCIIVLVFTLSGGITALLAPKNEVPPVALADIRKVGERMYRMAFPRMYAEDPEYNAKRRAILNALP